MSTALFSNGFGEIQVGRITFNVKKGWFGGDVCDELPMKHVTSVRHEVTRNIAGGIILLLIGLACLFSGSGGAMFLGLILGGLGVLLLMGRPTVTINTAGGDLRKSFGSSFQGNEAEAFVSAVRNALFAGNQ